MFQNVRSGSVQQGGSTITQQYVHNSFKLSRDGGISRKLKEAVLSIKLEQEMSKDEILEGYLNTMFFGRGAYGVAAASRAYFGIDVRQITDPGQAALLAGLIRAPAAAEPSEDPEEAARRRHTALVAMEEEGYITQEQVDVADAVPVAEPWVGAVLARCKLVDTLQGADRTTDYMGTDYLPAYIESELQAHRPRLFTDKKIDRRRPAHLHLAQLRPPARRLAGRHVHAVQRGRPQHARVGGRPRGRDGGRRRPGPGPRHGRRAATCTSRGSTESNYAVRGNGSDGSSPGRRSSRIVLAEALREGYSLELALRRPGSHGVRASG